MESFLALGDAGAETNSSLVGGRVAFDGDAGAVILSLDLIQGTVFSIAVNSNVHVSDPQVRRTGPSVRVSTRGVPVVIGPVDRALVLDGAVYSALA